MRLSGVLLSVLLAVLPLSSASADVTAEGPLRASASAAGATAYSELKLGGRLVAYAYWDGSTNKFKVSDAYGDGQSAVVRYRLGAGKRVYSAWNSEGQLTTVTRQIAPGGLKVHFRACRAARAERNFRCPRGWVTAGSRCLKHPGTKALKGKGVCAGTRGNVLREGSPQNGWGYRLRGRISAPRTKGKAARFEVRTHRRGDPWGGASLLTKVGARKTKTFDQVVHRGGYAFWIQYRLCSYACTAWRGDMVVGIASGREANDAG